MNCLTCKSETKYNRAVVDLLDDAIVGGLCRDCEREAYGSSLLTRPFFHAEGCADCPNDGRYALPEHKLDVSVESDNEYVEEGYDVVEETPVFCAVHLPLVTPKADSITETFTLSESR